MDLRRVFSNWWRFLTLIFIGFQVLVAVLYISDFLSSLFYIESLIFTWRIREIIDALVAVCLVIAPILLALQYRRLKANSREIRDRYLTASDTVTQLVNQEFVRWGLTPSECRVASYVLKGMSNAEIATLNGTKEGTVKAQCNALFKKSNTKNRSQFNSYFFEYLIVEQPLQSSSP